MEINLETDERVRLVVDGNCNFIVWGERNDEGAMVIKFVDEIIQTEKEFKNIIIKEFKKSTSFCPCNEWGEEEVLKRNPNYVGRIYGMDIFIGELK